MTLDSGAIFSDDRKHRFILWRTWDTSIKPVLFICLNPSTADETNNDPTCTRCINYSKAWGAGGFIMSNVYSYRSTNPKGISSNFDDTHNENERYILEYAKKAGIVILAWGNFGNSRGQVIAHDLVRNGIELYALKLNQSGVPAHPLYLPANLKPQRYM